MSKKMYQAIKIKGCAAVLAKKKEITDSASMIIN